MFACGIIFPAMAENKFTKTQGQLDQALAELKVTKDPERRRSLLREMGRLLTEAYRALEVSETVEGREPGAV